MAIGRSKGPRVIAVGEVSRIEDKISNKGELYAHDVTLDVGGGASVFVRVWEREAAVLGSVGVGRFWAAWAEVVVSTYNGRTDTSLSFDGEVSPGDLDLINSALSAPAKA
jgi:hypothetical protein